MARARGCPSQISITLEIGWEWFLTIFRTLVRALDGESMISN